MPKLDLKIIPFTYKHAHVFSKLRRDIDNDSEHLLAKKDERRENAIHIIAKLIISQRRTVTFLAFDNKLDIGYVSLVFPKFTKLKGNSYLTIAVREKYRGMGIGGALMDKAESYAKSVGVRRVELEVFGKNIKAIELYKKRGYETEGIKKEAVFNNGHFDDIVIMAKRLK
ncbi:GNAT family N-acetyltransferase [Candidatus Gracilibacteria bacterium]|nr:GNAT family N-acetyltransferase [Candidatus Gracilibacteria bacterium]MCF7898646.1 GNAT family N-acetyltransferase [Candidatus Paceibacterota bacterium]